MKRKHDATESYKHLGHGQVDSYSKSSRLGDYTNDSTVIFKCMYHMLKGFQFSCSDIRGLGIQITRLDNSVLSRKSNCVRVCKYLKLFIADQGTLKFKSPTKEETTVTETTTAEITTEETTMTEITKEKMTVDYNVYKELPESVQQELLSNYNLKFQHNKPVELPPWSQLDPTALLALPKEMRDQVIQAYGNNTPSSPLQMEGLDYDVNVWNELPIGK